MGTNIEGPTKIAVMDGVREYAEGFPVELCRYEATGRHIARAINEGGYNVTEVDIVDLIS